jgi:flagellar assembly protein FliH
MEATEQLDGEDRWEVYQYPGDSDETAWPAGDSWLGADSMETAGRSRDERHNPATGIESELRMEFDRRLAEETRRSFEAGRERGRMEGRQAEGESQAAARATWDQQRVRQATELIESFGQERDRYLLEVEHEVVELALAIAARILRREAQMDPLLLTGAVRVALGQLTAATEVRLRVPAAELDLWTEAMALLPNLAVKPKVLAGDGMRLGDCVIETEIGAVELGIRPQLGEIERGFFDRTGVAPVNAGEEINRVDGMLKESSR